MNIFSKCQTIVYTRTCAAVQNLSVEIHGKVFTMRYVHFQNKTHTQVSCLQHNTNSKQKISVWLFSRQRSGVHNMTTYFFKKNTEADGRWYTRESKYLQNTYGWKQWLQLRQTPWALKKSSSQPSTHKFMTKPFQLNVSASVWYTNFRSEARVCKHKC